MNEENKPNPFEYNEKVHKCLSDALAPFGLIVEKYEGSELQRRVESKPKVKYKVTKDKDAWEFEAYNQMVREMMGYCDIYVVLREIWAQVDEEAHVDFNKWLYESFDNPIEEAMLECGYRLDKL